MNLTADQARENLVQMDSFSRIEHFLDNIESKDREGRTPLMFAIEKGYSKTVRMLMNQGANIHARCDKNLRTPLHMAMYYHGREDIAEILLLNGADPNALDIEGSTPMLPDVRNITYRLLKLFLIHGADVGIENKHGMSIYKFKWSEVVWYQNRRWSDFFDVL